MLALYFLHLPIATPLSSHGFPHVRCAPSLSDCCTLRRSHHNHHYNHTPHPSSTLSFCLSILPPQVTEQLFDTFMADREVTYDIRRELGDEGEVTAFWTQSFGYQCYEVPWTRFRLAHHKFYGGYSQLFEVEWMWIG